MINNNQSGAANPPIYLKETHKYVTALPRSSRTTTRSYITSATGSTPHYESFISDDAYAEALSGLVMKCVDIIVIDPATTSVLLGTRQQEPQPGLWVIGGRKRAGETHIEAAQKNIKRELGIQVNADDLIEVGIEYDTMFDTRALPPTKDHIGQLVAGCHTNSSTFVIALDVSLVQSIRHNDEYAGLHWISLKQIIEA